MTQTRKVDAYYHGERRDLLEWLGGRHPRVLEIGCGAGGNAEWLRRHGAERIVGIEIDARSAERAREVFDVVLTGSVESTLGELDELFDLVICADVLEHLVNPWQIVDQLTGLVIEGGLLVVSVPNIRHYRALLRLAFGAGFRYDSQGTFDSTHLRFFDRKGVRGLVGRPGWEIERFGGSGGRRFGRLLWSRPFRIPAEYLVYQWHVVARRTAASHPARTPGNDLVLEADHPPPSGDGIPDVPGQSPDGHLGSASQSVARDEPHDEIRR
jgi:SAM-dependent methyltransferase